MYVRRYGACAFLILLGGFIAGCERATSPVLAAAQTKVEARSKNAEHACPAAAAGQKVRIKRLRSEDDREVMSVDPDPELGGEASLMWRGDLNADSKEDVILRFHELCGSAGECPWGVYASCGADQFVTVWGPTYTAGLEDPRRPKQGWADVYQIQRITTMKSDYPVRRTLRFEKGAYRVVPGFQKRVR